MLHEYFLENFPNPYIYNRSQIHCSYIHYNM